MKVIKLGKIAKIDISNVDKKTKGTDSPVVLCNFVDVYHNWAITNDMFPNLMKSTANENQIKRFSIHRGQVAITKDSETRDDIGVSTYIADSVPNGVLGYHCALITPDEKRLVGKFLNVVLHTPYAQKYFEMNASGSGQRYTLSVDTISNFPVPIPDLKIQHVIGDFFSSIDMKLATNNRICFELESMVKTIYDYWFTQFDFPNKNGKPYRSSGGAMVWNAELKRNIPKGWSVQSLSGISSLQPESVLPIAGTKYYHYSIPSFDESKCPTLEDGNIIASNKYIVPDNCILVSKLNPQFKRIWLINNPEDNSICSTEFLPVKATKTGVYVLYSLLNSTAFSIHLIQNATSSTGSRKRIDPNNCMSYKFPYNKEIFERFNRIIQPLLTHICSIPTETQALAALRDWLLPMLMNGQVSLKDKQEEKPQIKVSGFEQWIANQGYAARGDVDIDVLRDIYEAMDEDDQ